MLLRLAPSIAVSKGMRPDQITVRGLTSSTRSSISSIVLFTSRPNARSESRMSSPSSATLVLSTPTVAAVAFSLRSTAAMAGSTVCLSCVALPARNCELFDQRRHMIDIRGGKNW
jgi:hypothetical protein